MILKQIQLINFQSHKNTTIDLTKGINLIVGESRRGKSSIFRAMNWLYMNNFEGKADSFIRKGEKYTTVSVVLENDIAISRTKGVVGKTSVNSYTITYPDGKEQVFDSIGASVPQEVWDLLSVTPFTMPGEKKPVAINFCQQGEPAFLLMDSGPNKARILNSFTGVDKVDIAVRSLVSESREFGKQAKWNQSNIENLTEQIEDITPTIDKYKKLTSGLQKVYNDLKERQDKLSFIQTSIEKLKFLKEETIKAEEAIKGLKKIGDGSEILKQLETSYNKYKDILLLASKYQECQKAKADLKKWSDSQPPLGDLLYEELSTKYKNLCKLQEIKNAFEDNQQTSENIKEALKIEKETVKKLEQDYANALGEAGICPTCFSKVDKDAVKKALSNA